MTDGPAFPGVRRPVVGVPADVKPYGFFDYHVAGDKYLDAVARGAGCLPLVLPARGAGDALDDPELRADVDAMVRALDGLFLTGSAANVSPALYGQELLDPNLPADPARDSTTLAMIHTAIAAGVPLFAVCRGFQELNVAFGGTLHQAVHDIGRYADHREDPEQPLDVQYGHAHPVNVVPGGVLHGIVGTDTIEVNSVHGQGLDRLGDGLVVEGTAPDGLVEAISVADAPAFTLAVQWHPEFRHWQDPCALALFRAFGDACRARRQRRQPGG